MAKGKPVVNYKKCMACGVCVVACPFSCLDLVRTDLDNYRKAYPELISPDTCTSCGICERECPEETITLPEQMSA